MRFIGKFLRQNKRQNQPAARQPVITAIESLEDRIMLSGVGPRVTSAQADNRGLTTIFFDLPLNPSTVTTSSVLVFTAGQDGILNTSDDVQVPATVIYGAPQQRIIVNANLPVDTNYWVTVKANQVHALDGTPMDGEFSGTFPSGNGTPGGNFRIAATASSSTGSRIARFLIQGQALNVQLATPAQRPQGIPNFMDYVNSGSYDGTVIHRANIANQSFNASFIQGGGYYVANDPVLGARTVNQDIGEESGNNFQGTLAMANKGFANSTENQWFFNVTDNTSVFNGGGYSILGQVTSASFFPVLNNLVSYPEIDITTSSNAARFGDPSIANNFHSVPVINSGVTPDNVDPAADFIFVVRVSIKQIISQMAAFPAPGNASTNKSVAAPIVGTDPVVASPLFATTVPITSAWASLDPSGNKSLL